MQVVGVYTIHVVWVYYTGNGDAKMMIRTGGGSVVVVGTCSR